MTQSTKWRTYEEVARFLLNKISAELGLSEVEGKQLVPGRNSGTLWEIDAKGISEHGTGFVLIEMRRYPKRRLSQEDVAAVAYKVQDIGASGGIVVSPLPLQLGANKVATSAGVVAVQLNHQSTNEEYILCFLQRVMIGLGNDAITSGGDFLGGTLVSPPLNNKD